MEEIMEATGMKILDFFTVDRLYFAFGSGNAETRAFRFVSSLPQETTVQEFLDNYSYQRICREPGVGKGTANVLKDAVRDAGFTLRDEEAEAREKAGQEVIAALPNVSGIEDLFKLSPHVGYGPARVAFINRLKELFIDREGFEAACTATKPKPPRWKGYRDHWSQFL
jgi:hypothetical protein